MRNMLIALAVVGVVSFATAVIADDNAAPSVLEAAERAGFSYKCEEKHTTEEVFVYLFQWNSETSDPNEPLVSC